MPGNGGVVNVSFVLSLLLMMVRCWSDDIFISVAFVIGMSGILVFYSECKFIVFYIVLIKLLFIIFT